MMSKRDTSDSPTWGCGSWVSTLTSLTANSNVLLWGLDRTSMMERTTSCIWARPSTKLFCSYDCGNQNRENDKEQRLKSFLLAIGLMFYLHSHTVIISLVEKLQNNNNRVNVMLFGPKKTVHNGRIYVNSKIKNKKNNKEPNW